MPNPFAEELERLRLEGKMSVRELARRAHCGKSTVSDYLNVDKIPSPGIARHLDNALGAQGKLVQLANEQRQLRQGEEAPHAATAVGSPDGPANTTGDDVWRRTFLHQSLGLVAGAALPSLTESGDAGHLERMTAHRVLRAAHGVVDNLRGAQSVYQQAQTHHRQVLDDWRDPRNTIAERKELAALSSDTGGFVGFLTYDLGMAETAIRCYQEAAEAALEAADLSSWANLRGQMSRIAADQGHLIRAADLADHALHRGGTRIHPAVRCWLHAVSAHHHAGLDDAHNVSAALDEAWRLLGHCDDGEIPPYIGYISPMEIGKWAGHTFVRLATKRQQYTSHGIKALEAARAAWPRGARRGSAEVFTASARVYLASGELDQAARHAADAVRIATETDSARNLTAAFAAQSAITTRRQRH
ncbi:helix-turn-helix domain-containing protein [Streptomyces sp. NPDC059083]|uniref:helix-turn-helix domain-containing protein n=1 Tax=unclassified Streptomyces TaxID=2593676 RepID=UPI003677B0C5